MSKILGFVKGSMKKFSSIPSLFMTKSEVRFISGFSHINIGVTDVSEAVSYYTSLLGCRPIRIFENFRNEGFAKSAGFLTNPEEVAVSIAFVEIPNAGVTLELMQYHTPKTKNMLRKPDVNDVGGVRHIALKVDNISKAFKHVSQHENTSFINLSKKYKPFKIDNISRSDFRFFDEKTDANWKEKEKVCDIVGKIKYFYFFDKYGVQWEFEQGHHDLGSKLH